MTNKKDVERPADLLLWCKDGSRIDYKARVAADTEVQLGQTDSKRGLGFVVRKKGAADFVDFVLDRDHVAELAAFLQHVASPRLRKPLGRKRPQTSLVAIARLAEGSGKP